jgi:ABC-type uncharacterized transport system permease subunit
VAFNGLKGKFKIKLRNPLFYQISLSVLMIKPGITELREDHLVRSSIETIFEVFIP